MKKILLLFVCLLVTGVGSLWAQSGQVSGIVTENGQPLIGVSVAVKGGSSGVTTDENGRYTITVPQDATLVFSFIGMKTQEIVVGMRSVINVVMEADAVGLDEVVVVAYGTAKKGTFTGSASVVSSAEKMKDLPIASFENALQGAAAGVRVGTPNGQPGAQAEIRIRGTGSMNASNAPLYVIDGVPASSGNYSGFAVSGQSGSLGIMSTINPSDIENITILKDAAAISLYGSRGANGVILVTTKRGKDGALKINFKGSWGFSDWAMKNRPYLNADDAHALTLEGAYNQGIYNGMSEADARAYALVEANKYTPLGNNTDWESALFRNNGTNTAYEVSATGGNDKTTFYVSLGYRDELGMSSISSFDGYTGKANLSHKTDKWTVNAEVSMAKLEQGAMTVGTSYTNYYYDTRNWLIPNIPMYNPDGSFYQGALLNAVNGFNPVKDKELDVYHNDLFKSTTNLSVGYEFIKGLKLKETLSFDYIDILSTTVWPSNSNNGETHKGLTIKNNNKETRFYSSLLLTYEKTLWEDHSFDALVGWDVDDNRAYNLSASAKGFGTPDLWEMDVAAEPNSAGSNHFDDRIVSYFGRLNYSYKDRYYVSGTFRRDGSSRLGVNTRWGNFWSVSASWRAKEEAFLKDVTWLDNLKVRASYGVSGTLPSTLNGALHTYLYSPRYNDLPASVPARVANPDLSWERNYVLDVGLEAQFLDRIHFEFDFYDRQTKDLLLSVPVSLATGFSTMLLNYGEMNNRGVEFSLGVDIFKGDFQWTSTLLGSHNRNKITKIYNGEEFANGDHWIREGHSIYSFRAREWAGVDPATGDSMWYIYKYDDDGNVTDKSITKDPNVATRDIQAKADPTFTGGWRNTLYWKGIDLDILVSFSLGGHSWDNGWGMTSDGLNASNAISELQLDRWQKPGDEANFPRRMHGGGHGNYTSSRWIHSTDHLRLKTLTLGYTFPLKWANKAKLQNARIFVAGNNLLTLAAYDDYDPELSIGGATTWDIPVLKSFTFGVELTF